MVKDSSNATTLPSTIQANGVSSTPITLSYGTATFYVDAIHSTVYENQSYFTLKAAVSGVVVSNVLQFSVGPTLYNWDIAVVHYYPFTMTWYEDDYVETAATIDQAEAQALAPFSVYDEAYVDTVNSGSLGAAN